MKLTFTAAASAALIVAGASSAWAHAELKQATPAVDGKVQTAPTEVTLKFSERLEPAFTAVIVRDAVGKRVNRANVQIDKADRTVRRTSLEPLSYLERIHQPSNQVNGDEVRLARALSHARPGGLNRLPLLWSTMGVIPPCA